MNDPISRQLPMMDAGVSSRQVERPLQQKKVAVLAETEKSHGKSDAVAEQGNKADLDDNISEKVELLNRQLQDMQRGLRFSVDDSSGRIVVKLIDLATDKVLRQIPSEEVLSIISNVSNSKSFIISEEA